MSRARTATAALVLAAAAVPFMGASPAAAAPVAVPAEQWDFNGDGRADLAVGSPGEDISNAQQAGSVSVFLSDTSGDYSAATQITQDTPGVPNAAETGDQFGYAMTSGDYDGDGYADLAVAANREDIGTGSARKTDAGLITVLWGSDSGLTGTGSRQLEFQLNGESRAFAFAGDALASGDMNGDGTDELAVGAPGAEWVRVYVGATGSAALTSYQTVNETLTAGKKHTGDLFGESLAMGDFDDDGRADLVVGVPYDTDDRGYSVGAVVVVPGRNDPQPLDTAAAKRWSPDSTGVQGSGHTFTVNDLPDSFGRTLAVGDFDADGDDDLAVGTPGVPLARTSGGHVYQDAGRVTLLFGSSAGITAASNRLVSQESAGVAGSSTTGGLFGASLDGARVAGADLLAVGTAKESIWMLPGAGGAGSVKINQDSDGVVGSAAPGNAFGAFVRFLSTSGANDTVLAVGAPGEDASSGRIHLLPVSGGVPTGVGAQRLSQDSPGVDGSTEDGDAFGWLGDSH